MESVLNVLNDYIIVVDKEGKIQFCNERLLLKLSYGEYEIKTKNINKVLDNKFLYHIYKVKIDKKINVDLIFLSNKNEKIEVNSEIVISEFNGKEAIYIISKDICEKSYTREDLEILLDNIPIYAWIKNIDGKYIYTNKTYADDMKCNKVDMIGKNTQDYWEKIEENDDFFYTELSVRNSKIPMLVDQIIKVKNEKKHLELYKAPVMDNDNNIKYTIGTARDVTLKTKLENEIKKDHKKILALNKIITREKNDVNIIEILDNIGKNVIEHLKADGLSIYLYDEKHNELKLVSKQGIAKLCIKKDLEIIKVNKDKLKESLYNSKSCNLSNDFIKNVKMDKTEKLGKKVGYSGMYAIQIGEELIGLLNTSYLDENKPKFNQDTFIDMICMKMAMIINNHKLSSELKEEFEKRQEIEKELETFLEVSVDMHAIISDNQKFELISPSIIKNLGWSYEELVSKNPIDLIHPDDKENIIYIFRNKLDSAIRICNRVLCNNGQYKWIKWNFKYIQEKKYFVLTGRDITKEKEEEEQRKKLEEAIQIESIKNEFFANISHEFKTPLNIILGTMQLLDKNISNNNIFTKNGLNLNRHVNYIKQNSYRLLRLVNNLIDMTRIDTGYYELKLDNYNIVNIIEDITLSVAQYIENKNINLVFDTNTEDLVLACDPDKIERIILNLLSNAIKYTDKDGEIFVKLEATDDKVIISVKDNGAGISKEKLPYIFERFRQGDYLLTRNCEGSGIGLSLIKSLIEMHDGNIYVVSEENIGSKFTFELPIRLVENEHNIIEKVNGHEQLRIEKCNIEFSDIYDLSKY